MRPLRFVSLLALVTAMPGLLPGQTKASQNIQVQLQTTVKAAKAKAGERIKAQTVTPFVLPDNRGVPAGSTILGEVREAASDGSSVSLVFDRVDLGHGKQVPLKLMLVAAMNPNAAEKQTNAGNQQNDADSNTPPAGEAKPQMQILHGGPETPHNTPESLKTPTRSSAPQMVAAHSGSVIGMPGVTLLVSDQPGGVSTFDSNQKDLKLNSGLQLILKLVP